MRKWEEYYIPFVKGEKKIRGSSVLLCSVEYVLINENQIRGSLKFSCFLYRHLKCAKIACNIEYKIQMESNK